MPRFGMEGPTHTGVDTGYWDGLRAGELRIQRCGSPRSGAPAGTGAGTRSGSPHDSGGCGRWIWGPQPICPACHNFEPGWEAVEPVGVVYSWTRTQKAFHPTAPTPYTVVLVELPHAGRRRVFGVYTDEADPVIGAPVRGTVEPAPDEHSWPLFRWAPA